MFCGAACLSIAQQQCFCHALVSEQGPYRRSAPAKGFDLFDRGAAAHEPESAAMDCRAALARANGDGLLRSLSWVLGHALVP